MCLDTIAKIIDLNTLDAPLLASKDWSQRRGLRRDSCMRNCGGAGDLDVLELVVSHVMGVPCRVILSRGQWEALEKGIGSEFLSWLRTVVVATKLETS